MRFSNRFWGVVAVSATFAGGPSGAADLIPFRIGEASPANTYLAIWMARDAGFYEARGLKLEVVKMTGGRDIADAFAAGRIDAMHIGLSSVVRANATGADLRAFGSLSNVIRFALFAKPGVKSAADLKGGTIGISSTGSESDATLTTMLAKLGLTRADVTIKELGTKRLAPVKDGAVTASALNEPDRSLAYAAGLTALVDLAPERIPWLFSGLVARRDALQKNRDALTRFLQATIEGNRIAISDEARAKAVLKKEIGIDDPKIIDIVYADFKEQTPINVEVSVDGARAIIERIAKPDASKKLEDYIDASLGDALKASGFYEEMTKKYPVK
jgi:ABC-type nitrate/sulfonate/bicarbonate transport system substrate-binding protein